MKLSEVYAKFSAPDAGGDKGTAHSYIEIYESEITKRKDISLLEIGIWEGHSIAMWQEYFQDSEIIGVDIDLSRVKFDLHYAIKGDATRLLPGLADKLFDYVIDDGSHLLSHQIASFKTYWPSVKLGGKYFIEDIAGDFELGELTKMMAGLQFRIYDNRTIKKRSDDILLVVQKGRM